MNIQNRIVVIYNKISDDLAFDQIVCLSVKCIRIYVEINCVITIESVITSSTEVIAKIHTILRDDEHNPWIVSAELPLR